MNQQHCTLISKQCHDFAAVTATFNKAGNAANTMVSITRLLRALDPTVMFGVHAGTREQSTNRKANLQPNRPELAFEKAAKQFKRLN